MKYNFVILSKSHLNRSDMDGFFSVKTFLRLLAAAIVLAALIVLVDEKMGNTLLRRPTVAGEAVQIVERTVEVTRLVERVITATPEPVAPVVAGTASLPPVPYTVTMPVTVPPSLSPTPEGLDVLDDGVTVWCLPKTSYADTNLFQISEIPTEAVQSKRVDGSLTIITQVKSCTFMVSFNSSMPDGTSLKIQDLGPDAFVNTKLTQSLNNPSVGVVTLDHYYVIDPPYWNVTFIVSVVGPDGTTLWEEPVVFRRQWIPDPCPNGMLPDPLTSNCE